MVGRLFNQDNGTSNFFSIKVSEIIFKAIFFYNRPTNSKILDLQMRYAESQSRQSAKERNVGRMRRGKMLLNRTIYGTNISVAVLGP